MPSNNWNECKSELDQFSWIFMATVEFSSSCFVAMKSNVGRSQDVFCAKPARFAGDNESTCQPHARGKNNVGPKLWM